MSSIVKSKYWSWIAATWFGPKCQYRVASLGMIFWGEVEVEVVVGLAAGLTVAVEVEVAAGVAAGVAVEVAASGSQSGSQIRQLEWQSR